MELIMSKGTKVMDHSFVYDVIVVGGGISGLTAANYLVSSKKRVLLIEATNRIGGRILSLPILDKAIDLGASWIHGIKNNPIKKIANELNLKTIATTYTSQDLFSKFSSFDLYNSQGEALTSSQVSKLIQLNEDFTNYLDEKFTTQENNTSMEEALNSFSKDHGTPKEELNNLKFMVRSTYSYEHGEELKKLSANVEQPYTNSMVTGNDVVFPLGYSQILKHFMRKPKILFSKKVTHIHYHKKYVSIFTNQKSFKSQQVIISVPLGTLKANQIEFTPSLPDWKKNAILKLGFNTYNKIYLIFDNVFWDKEKEWIAYIPSDKYINESIEIMNYYKVTGKPILLVFTAGKLARTIETWSNENIIKYFINILKNIYKNKEITLTSYYITRWNKNVNQRGSYSYLPPRVDFNIFKFLAKPVANKLFFAGEATIYTDPGTVHGAYLSGIEAAKKILSL